MADKDFTFTYDCGAGQTGNLTVKPGATAVSGDINHGSVCTVTEDAQSANLANYTVVVPQAKQVTVVGEETTNVSFENAYTIKKGKFSVTKSVTGVDNALVADKEFTFNYNCGGTEGTLKVKAGETVVGPEFDHGTVCKVTEDESLAQVDDYTVVVQQQKTSPSFLKLLLT